MITTTQLFALVFLLLGAVVLLVLAVRYRKGAPERRTVPVFHALADEVGYVAEEGKLIHVTLGSGSLLGNEAVTSVAALEGLTAFCDLSAAYDTPPIITTGDPTLYLLADDWMRRAYARLGNVARYRPTLVQFVASTPVTYAAMTATYLSEKGVGSNIMLGAFRQEASLLADAATRQGTPTAGGAVSSQALAALYPALGASDLVMGEELFSGGAEVIGRLPYMVGLFTQDFLRWVVIVAMVVLAVLSLLGLQVG